MSDSLRPHESQHTRSPCPSPTPGVHSGLHPSSQWCHPAISSFVVPFSSCPQSLPASKSFPMSQLFAWGGQSTEVSALASFLPKKSQGWSPSEWTGWISLQSKGLSRRTAIQPRNPTAVLNDGNRKICFYFPLFQLLLLRMPSSLSKQKTPAWRKLWPMRTTGRIFSPFGNGYEFAAFGVQCC